MFGYGYRSTNDPNHGPVWKTQSFFLKGICTVIFWQDNHGRGNLRKFCRNTVGKSFRLEMFICQASKRIFLISVRGRYQIGWRSSRRLVRFGKILMKYFDLGEPTSFLDHVYLGYTQRECKINNGIVANNRDVFESRIYAGAKEKLPTRASGKLDAETISSWSYDMEGHAKKCVDKYIVNLRIKTTQQLYKVATLFMDDHQLKRRRNWVSRRIVYKFVHKLFWNVYCYAENTAQQCKFGLFQDSDFAGDLEDSTSTSGGVLCIFGSHVCANKLDVQETDFSFTQFYRSRNHFSRCRFDVWTVFTAHSLGIGGWSILFRTEQNRWTQERAMEKTRPAVVKPNVHNPIPIKRTDRHSHKHWSHSIKCNEFWYLVLLLYVFEDNEAVIKMIIKGRRPTMRHVSRTHSVALDWLFVTINLDPKIQIRYIDTKNHFADMLIKWNFTSDELNNLLHLFQYQPSQLHLSHQEF